MGDLDVQDVRDMVAKQKADALATQHLMLKMKRMVENPTMDTDDIQMLQRLKSINDRRWLKLKLSQSEVSWVICSTGQLAGRPDPKNPATLRGCGRG